MPPKAKKTKKAEPADSSIELVTLNNKVDGLQNLLGNAMAQIQTMNNKVNENWTKFVFHDHRRFDSAGPQFYNPDYEKAWMQEQERQKPAQERALAEAKAKAEKKGTPPEREGK